MASGEATLTDAASIRALWSSNGCVRNAWLTIPDPYLAEIVASSAAVDTVTLDLQHGLFDRRNTVECVRAIAAHGPAPCVRLPALDEPLISFLLDAGVIGLILPSTNSAKEAAAFVAAGRFPPRGNRSYGPNRAVFADEDVTDIEAITLAMIETAPGLAAAGEIAATEGLDGLFVGPGDLGIALGIGQAQDRQEAEFEKALSVIRLAATTAGKVTGIHASSTAYAAKMANAGFQFVTVWVDAVALKSTLNHSSVEWRKQIEQ